VWKPNEDFCHIIVDNGMFDHHLPDSVVSAIDRFCNQYTSGKGKSFERRLNVPTNAQKHTSNTAIGLHRQVTMLYVLILNLDEHN